MEKSHLKNSLIAAGIAVFAGVITLGANVVFGATTPTQDPATAGLVAPTFSGLDVQGPVQNSQVVKQSISDVPQPVQVNDDLQITGNGIVNGNTFANKALTVGGLATLGADLTVTGNSTIHGLFSFKGATFLGDIVDQGNLIVTGNASVGTGKMLSVDNVQGGNGGAAAGDSSPVTFWNPIKAAGSAVSFLSPLQIPSGDGEIRNKDNNPIIQTWRDAVFGDFTALNSGYAWTGSEPVSVVAGANGVFFEKGNSGAAYQSQLGKIDLSGNLNMAGGITATKIGSYNKVNSAGSFAPYVKLPANGGNMSSNVLMCPAGNIAVNCGFSLYSDNAGNPYNGSGIYLEGMVNGAAGTAGCNYAIVNSTALDKYAKLTVMCFDPTINN
ncbi:hypothetical protein HZA40_05040 [Candidatus Peregrinibacteria bacterium]|nr:hypothetical protein [Candidatus Peregrinibacteria bacterium]